MRHFEQQKKSDSADLSGWPAWSRYGRVTEAPFVLVCEHASRFIPPAAGDLGLSEEAQTSHAAYDIGALDLAKCLSHLLQAPLVAGEISRLVYDCNRPLSAPDCIPERSEVFDVPGNRGLGDAERRMRFDLVHTPFHDMVSETLDAVGPSAVLVTVHSFTPIYNGLRRTVEIGYLSHEDDRLARACLGQEQRMAIRKAALDEPYSATDGVTYSLQKHGVARGLLNVMIEVRNDLIDTPAKAQDMAEHLASVLSSACDEVVT